MRARLAVTGAMLLVIGSGLIVAGVVLQGDSALGRALLGSASIAMGGVMLVAYFMARW